MVKVSGSSPLERIKKYFLSGQIHLIKKIISQYKEKSFLIAYSGGIDSTVLLYQMFKIRQKNSKIKIRAIHINHNIHPSSKEWEKHCTKICQKYQIPIISIQINIHCKKNLEETLRIQRYNIFYKNLFFNEILLTAHHLNDQCETFFLFLKRGSGPTGLSGMLSKNLLGDKKIIRPFLEKTKKELQKIAYENNLKWIEDSSNCNINYDRNFIRHKLMPILEKKWPFFLKNCFRTTVICKEEIELKNMFLKEKIKKFININESLNIENFKNIEKIICKELIRYWISLKNIKTPSYKVIECIYNEIINSKKDANPKIIIQKNEIRRYKKCLYFIKKQKNINNMFLFWHDKNEKLFLPNNLGYLIKHKKGFSVPEPKKNELINIRFQFEGKIFIVGRDKRRKIKKVWQENNIAPWLRNQIPLLFYNNRFISAIGVFLVKENLCNQEKRIEKIWKISWINSIQLNYSNSFTFI